MDIAKYICFFILICIGLIDLRWRKIPDCLLMLLMAFGYVRICILQSSLIWAVASLLIVGIPLLLLGVREGDAIGGGDIKLCAAAAFCFGAEIALWTVAATAASMILVSKLSGRRALPMAPFLAIFCIALV